MDMSDLSGLYFHEKQGIEYKKYPPQYFFGKEGGLAEGPVILERSEASWVGLNNASSSLRFLQILRPNRYEGVLGLQNDTVRHDMSCRYRMTLLH